MRNKLFYLFGTAFLLCSIGTFTSCTKIENISEEITDSTGGGGTVEEEELVDLNGEYYEGGDNTLVLNYNGEALTGRKVTFMADEENATATLVLSGMEKDLSAMLGGLLEFKLTTYSPIPGEKEVTLTDVDLFTNSTHNVFSFSGKDVQPTRTITYEGKIKEGIMTMDITHVLANKELAGTWNLGPLKFSMLDNVTCAQSSPLWIDWDTEVYINPGEISFGDTHLGGLDQAPNSLFTWVMSIGDKRFTDMMGMAEIDFKIQQMIAGLLKGVTAQLNGCMFATYSYSGDMNNPAWSSEMSHNIIRYYYGEEANQIFIEANADFILSAMGGLIPGTRASDPEGAKEAGKKLLEALKPALEKGIPCTYVVTGDKMKINLDGAFMLDILRKLADLANDGYANEFLMSFIQSDPTLAPYAPNVKLLLESLPNALKYKSGDAKKGFKGECTFVKVGFQLVKAAN